MLTAFTAGLLLITISELGDKTFFIAVILSMHHPRRLVFTGVVAALAAMTILSVMFGQVVSLLPKSYIHYAEIVLFIAFGLKLIYDANKMAVSATEEVVEEAQEAVEKADLDNSQQKTVWSILLKSFALTFIAEWGDRTQIACPNIAPSVTPMGLFPAARAIVAICVRSPSLVVN